MRPLLDSEKAKGAAACVEAPSTTVVQLPPRRDASEPYRFDFDRVYKMSNPGEQAKPLLSATMPFATLCHLQQALPTLRYQVHRHCHGL